MGKISTTLLLVLTIAFFFSLANSQSLLDIDREDDTIVYFEYTSFPRNPVGSGLLYVGDAHVPSGTQYLRLTNTNSGGNIPRPRSASQVMFGKMIRFWSGEYGFQRSFETTFVFSITPSTRAAAEGITFFIAPYGVNFPLGDASGNLGVFNSNGVANNVLAVEFDTYSSGDFEPTLDGPHIGIDLASRASNVSTPFDSGTGANVTANIQYNAITKVMTVTATSGDQTATLSLTYDLKNILTELVYVGISSSTGENVELNGIHTLYSWTFSSARLYTAIVDQLLEGVLP